MAHRIADRIKETASTSGTGSFTLAGAVSGFVTFASALTTNGDTTWYCAVNGSEWEVGLGTRTSSTVLARTTILASSNAGAAVNFSVAPTVFSTVPSSAMAPLHGPAVSAYRGTSNQSVTSGAYTKVQLNEELFDSEACFDSATNFRWTPNVSGYYQVSFAVNAAAASGMSYGLSALYKNGASCALGNYGAAAGVTEILSCGSKLIYMNGTTDYLELFGLANGTTVVFKFGEQLTHLTGFLARPA